MSYLDRENVLLKKEVELISIQSPSSTPGFLTIVPKNYPFKRAFDIIISVLVTVFILSWLLPILAILIKLDSKGPVFFIQKRVGAFGKVFRCIKLRTMVVNAEANTLQAVENDPRITPLGKFLRFSSMDELPQFFNVLIGDMSVVGPRPHMISDSTEFAKLVRHYKSRYSIKPGITGMAQVKGYRGNTKDFFDIAHRSKWDMFYVRNRCFSLDVKILRLTVASMIGSVYKGFFPKRSTETETQTAYRLETPEYLN
jgi:putative colanic acid biosysnthesis UDP-glucose lipid carrier transferase